MKPIILQIPDSFPDRRAWLERQLVGLELGDLVTELEALHQAETPQPLPAPSLEQAFAGQLSQVLNQGLSVLSEKQLGLLLKHPSLLAELQDTVLEQGSMYWDAVPRSDEFEAQFQTHQGQLKQQLTQEVIAIASTTPDSPSPRPLVSGTPTRPQSSYTRWAVVAGLLLGVTLWMSRPAGPNWGFDRSGVLTANVSAEEYLNSLATAAGDWFNKRPDEPQAVATRLREFIHGCQTLIDAPHSQLSADDRAWLVERCRTWKSTLETQLAALEAQSRTAAETLESADETIRKLQNALSQRADEVA